MIDVPIRVKDALRDGRRLKNYKFKVVKETYDQTGPQGVYWLDEAGNFTVYCPIGTGASPYLEYKYIDSSSGTAIMITEDVDGVVEDGRLRFDFTIPDVAGGGSFVIYDTPEASFDSTDIQIILTYMVIDNTHLVSESVKFDERMCSGSTLKFGLCEGSSLEFQYFGYPSILGKTINSLVEVQYEDSDGTLKWYEIPMGYFAVDEVSRQASTGIMKVVAYNKLKSEYLDAKAYDAVVAMIDAGEIGHTGSVSFYYLLRELLEGYRIKTYQEDIVAGTASSSVVSYNIHTIDDFHLSTKEMQIYFDGSALSQGQYYKIKVNAKAIFELIASYYDYRNHIVNVSAVQQMTLYDYAMSDLGGAEYFGGLLSVRFHGDLTDTIHQGFGQWVARSGTIYETDYIIDTGGQLHMSITLPEDIFDTCFSAGDIELSHLILSAMELQRIDTSEEDAFKEVTLRELQSAVFETSCQYGKLDRVTDLFAGVELNNSSQDPADTLYPGTNLHPGGSSFSSSKSTYSKLWADENNVQKFRDLIITYKGLDENNQEKDFTLQRQVNVDGTQDYNCSDNWIFRNLVWTSAQIGAYADAMVLKMQNVSWFPFEMWAPGLPYLETGDQIEIPLGEDTYTSYILQRDLNGIQNLQDTFINGELDIF